MKDPLSPVHYVWGDEDFLIDEEITLLVNAALREEERGFNLDVVDAGEVESLDILSIANTFPMMADRRVVVVKQAEKMDVDSIRRYLENPTETTILILAAYDPDKRRSTHKDLLKRARSHQCGKLKETQLPGWIKQRAGQQGYRVETPGIQMLIEFAGSVLREIHNELNKLYAYVGDRKTITADDVQLVSGMSKQFNIFELQRALGQRDERRSIEMVERMLDAGQNAIMINTMLGKYFMKLRRLSDLRKRGASEYDAGVAPFHLGEYRAALTMFTDSELEHAILEIARADEKLKGSLYTPKQILEFTAASILKGDHVAVPN